jgi:hypothetical protein
MDIFQSKTIRYLALKKHLFTCGMTVWGEEGGGGGGHVGLSKKMNAVDRKRFFYLHPYAVCRHDGDSS